MNTRQLIAIIGILIVLAIIAVGLAYVAPSPVAENTTADEVPEIARQALGLSAQAHISVDAEERDYYALSVYPNGLSAGPGYLVIAREVGNGLEIISESQGAPECGPIEAANVPLEIITHCVTTQGELLERALD